jgi:hypothetical protein
MVSQIRVEYPMGYLAQIANPAGATARHRRQLIEWLINKNP